MVESRGIPGSIYGSLLIHMMPQKSSSRTPNTLLEMLIRVRVCQALYVGLKGSQ